MAITFFTPKITCSLITGGSACAGGGAIYYYQLPATWRELLTKWGYALLTQDNEFKGIYNDQKEKDIWKNTNDFNSVNDSNAGSEVKKYCNKELDGAVAYYTSEYYTKRQKLISFCTVEGIVTVKARLIQSGKNDWIGEDDADKYKAVFSVYRYDTKFISWLKEGGQNDSLSATSTVSENYEKLKNKCSSVLKMPYTAANDHVFNRAAWWCAPLEHDKIEDRIKAVKNGWEKETVGSTIQNKWKDTETITNQIKKDLSKQNDASLSEGDYSQWCNEHLEKKLSEDDSYQDKYIALMSACKKQST